MRLVLIRSATAGRAEVTTSGTVTAATKSIDVIMGPHQGDESEIWKGAVRSQAGLDKTSVKILGPPEPPSTQADLVRGALAHHPRVLLVESTNPVDPPLFRSIEDARNQGIPVVIVGRPPAGEKPAPNAGDERKTKSAPPDPFKLDTAKSTGKSAGHRGGTETI